MDQLADATEMMGKQVISVQDTMGQTDHASQPHSGHEETRCNATQPSNDTKAVQHNVPPFLKMPLEIRNQIYWYLLSTKYNKVDFRHEKPGYHPWYSYSPRATRTYQFHPSILAVNRQINHEASQTLRENLFVKVSTDTFVDAEGVHEWNGLPIVALGCLASRVRYHAMELTLISKSKSLIHPYTIFMFPGDDLATFCRFLLGSRKSANPKSELSITMTGVAPAMMTILKLMEPFRRLYGMASVRITGKVEAKYKSDLITRMMKPALDIDAFFQECQDSMEQGDQAATNKEFSTAIARYKRALEEGEDFCGVNGVYRTILKSGNFRGQCFEIAFTQIKFALGIKLAITYINLGDHHRAHEWIVHTVAEIGYFSYMSDIAFASVFKIAARAGEWLNLVEQAAEVMKKAEQHGRGGSDLADLAMKKLKTVKILVRGEVEGLEEL